MPVSLTMLLFLLAGGFAVGGLAFPARSSVFYGVAVLLVVIALILGAR
jgi:hypothetical protein